MIERVDVWDYHNENPVFRAFVADHHYRYAVAADVIKDMPKPCLVVDAACGCGYGYEHLNLPDTHYVGLDRSVDAIRECRIRYPKATYMLADLGTYRPFATLDPDVIVSLETAEHLKNAAAFLKACRLALRPGGLLIFSAPTCLTMDFDPYHRRDLKGTQWLAMLLWAGFRVEAEYTSGFEASFRDFLGTVPTTWAQKGRILRFLLTHPRYLVDRVWNWGIRRRFEWESTLFICRKATDDQQHQGGYGDEPAAGTGGESREHPPHESAQSAG